MKRLLMSMFLILAASTTLQAYEINGMYGSLVTCTYGQYDYQYGNIGIYNVNGQMYRVFFGSNYCEN